MSYAQTHTQILAEVMGRSGVSPAKPLKLNRAEVLRVYQHSHHYWNSGQNYFCWRHESGSIQQICTLHANTKVWNLCYNTTFSHFLTFIYIFFLHLQTLYIITEIICKFDYYKVLFFRFSCILVSFSILIIFIRFFLRLYIYC